MRIRRLLKMETSIDSGDQYPGLLGYRMDFDNLLFGTAGKFSSMAKLV